jgi:hypothetical protein
MAMNGTLLGKEIADAITHSQASAEAKAAVLELWQKIGNAIVNHITTNAVIPSGISVTTQVSGTASVDPATHQGAIVGSGAGQTSGTGKVT